MSRIRVLALFIAASWLAGSAAADPPAEGSRFPKPSNEDAWRHLPRSDPKLPNWARVLAESLPRTTAAMLALDYVHRANSPIGPITSGKLRWAAADALGCDYAREYAAADLKRAGLTAADLKQLAGDPRDLSKNDRLLLAFARKMSLKASDVTDEEVAELVGRFGPGEVVGFVHTLAYANFQCRVLLALGVEVEPGGPLPPLDVKFDRKAPATAPPRPDKAGSTSGAASGGDRPDWLGRSFGDVQKALDQQKARKARIPMPDPSSLAHLSPESRARTAKIAWSTVSQGYQPALTKAWFDCMNTFDDEAKLDEVFANTLFWVVTRTNDCFY